MCLIIEILMLLFGCVALITGKMTISRKYSLEGNDARTAGFILMLPIPLVLGISFFAAASGSPLSQDSLTGCETLLVLGALLYVDLKARDFF